MSVTVDQHTHQRAHRECNELVRKTADRRSRTALPFICECDDAGCCSTVWLSGAEYDEARRHALPVVAASHRALDEELPLEDAVDALWAALMPVPGSSGTSLTEQ